MAGAMFHSSDSLARIVLLYYGAGTVTLHKDDMMHILVEFPVRLCSAPALVRAELPSSYDSWGEVILPQHLTVAFLGR